MKVFSTILVLFFIASLAKPSIISLIEKSVDSGIFKNFFDDDSNEEEKQISFFNASKTTSLLLYLPIYASMAVPKKFNLPLSFTPKISTPPPKFIFLLYY